jgi:hypothetical protein
VTSDTAPISQQIAARYFEMWNTGDSAIAAEILSPGWVDHAHPEVTGPRDVKPAVEQTREAQPDLRFHIEAILGDGDLVAVVGTASRGPHPSPAATRLIWLVRVIQRDFPHCSRFKPRCEKRHFGRCLACPRARGHLDAQRPSPCHATLSDVGGMYARAG